MLRRTSKRVKEVVDKMRLSAVVRLSRSFWSFWSDARNGGAAANELNFGVRVVVWVFIGTQKRLAALPSALFGSRRDGHTVRAV